MRNLTAFLILRNEEVLLPRCLASLAGVVDAIVALDTGSQDDSLAILERAVQDPRLPPVRWQSIAFTDFGSVRQAALEMVDSEWALWIDADEAISPELADRLRGLRASGELDRRDAWELRLDNHVLGRRMRGRNLAGQYRVRLFRTRLARITPSAVHEGIVLEAGSAVGRLSEPLRHDTMTSWRQYLRKVDLYTDLEVRRGRRRGNPLHLLVTGPATLWREYLVRGGYRDGWPGLVWAATTAASSILRDWKLLLRDLRWRPARRRRPGTGRR